MKKVYTSPSSQPANIYAVGNTNEQEQCRRIGAALDRALTRCGFESKVGLSGTMYTRTTESNTFGAHLHLPIHTNAFDGKVAGLRIMISKLGGEAEQIAKAIMATLAPITPGASDGISAQPRLYEIQNTKALCVYIEVGFHDNKEEARWIINHTEEIAEAIARGVCNHYKVTYKAASAQAPAAKPEPIGVIYRVQVGAFSKKANAEKKMQAVKSAGFDAFLVCVDDKLWRVQIGAFSEKENADKTLARVQAAGFSGYVTKLGGDPVAVTPPEKTVDEIAREVIIGKWGIGRERRTRLLAAGYDYTAVQERVNELLK